MRKSVLMKIYQFLLRLFLCLKAEKSFGCCYPLNLDADTTKNLYRDYLELYNLDVYCHLLDDLGADLPEFTGLYQILNNNGLLKSEFIKILSINTKHAIYWGLK